MATAAAQTDALTPKSGGGRPRPFLTFFGDCERLRRLWRYAATSVVASVVSEITLLLLYGTGALGAAPAAVMANLAGTFPSYAMSRYWIWPEADRRHVGRQMTWYWLISVVSLVLSSVLTGIAAAHAPSGHTAHMVVVGVAYAATYGVLWMAKFVLYQTVLFRPRRPAPSCSGDLGAEVAVIAAGTMDADQP